MKTWYLLYGGQSCDGRGDGDYIGRTTSVAKARSHFKNVDSNPYSTGYVLIVTDNKAFRAFDITDLDSDGKLDE